MKNIFNKFAFFIALSFVFISCGNLTTSENDDSIPQGKGKITISTDLQNGRSVLPTAIDETTTELKWELVGIKDGTQQIIKSWTDGADETGTVTAYKSMTSDLGIVIDTGTWDFTLTASNTDGKNVLSATISTTINAGENKLNFVMQEATENAASGSIEFTLNFPGNVVDNVVAKLFKYENNDTEISNQTLSVEYSSTDNCSSVKYSYPDATTEELKSGYYILKIELQQSNDSATAPKVINTYSCLIRVAPGLLSQGKYTLTDLAQLYTINYECNQGSIGNPLTTTSYNAYTSFALPEPTLDGHYFAGWYTDSELTYPVELDENYKYRIRQDTILYAKWNKEVTGITHADRTLYISNYEGLCIFRDIVNGSLPMAITIPANESISGAKSLDWSAMSSGNWLSVELEEDIYVTDAWIPIGRPDASRDYGATFDGNNHTITLSNGINSNEYVALFSFVTGTIKNLVVEGNIKSEGSNAVAGICACSYGGTFEHCVNKCIINSNTSSGTGGIVGYSAYDRVTTIKSCVNMGEISSSLSTIGGIVGTANPSSDITIENSINLGKITGISNVSGIFGLGSASTQKIIDCINIGEIAVIPSDDALSTYAAGIICSSYNVIVSNCISVGNIINNTSDFQGAANFGAINYSRANGSYSNCYYDSSKINNPNDSNPPEINPQTTSELCNLDSSILSNWLIDPSRYPLPNIVATDNLEGISKSVWDDICELAKVDTSSSGSSGTATGTPVSDFSILQTKIASAPTDGTVTELYLTNDINMTEYLNINSGQNIVLKTNGNYSIYRGSGFTGSFFTVNSGAALTLGGSDYTITLDGRDSSLNEVSASYPFIVVNGDFTFEKKCIMQYNTNNSTSSNNIGGGIVVNSGKLTINEGIIQYCQATKGGGINVTADAEIIVNGGKIVNNAASGNGGGIAIKSATLKLDCGSEISGNKSTLSSASSSAGGGGIYANGNANITLNECIIKDNITNSAGGGVFASVATTTISENAIIQNNGCDVNLSDSCNFYGTWNDSGSTTNYNIVNGQETETLSYLYNAVLI